MTRRWQVGAMMVALWGCASRPARLVVVGSSLAETVSFLGDSLYAIPLTGSGGPERMRWLTAAREALARDTTNLTARLRLARITADLGRFREAIGQYNRMLEAHFSDARVLRGRGEVLLRMRLLDQALGDLRKAGLLAIGRGPILETESLLGESADSAAGLSFTTVQFRTFFFQGIAHYCRGEYATAYPVFAEAARVAQTTDDQVRAILWLFFSARRIGAGEEGARVLELVNPEWAQRSDLAELWLLFGYKGLIPTDTIRQLARSRSDEVGGLLSYGLAYSLLLRPDRRTDAEPWLERARSGGNWSTLPYLAAEADLARLRGRIVR